MICSKPKFSFVSWRLKSIFLCHLSIPSLLFFLICNLTFCYANDCSIVNVGASYGGGTVFCVSNTSDTSQCVTTGAGYYGLFMANEDQVNYDSNSNHGVTWASVESAINAISDSDGATNTATIIAALPSDNPSNNAAWVCHRYTGGGYTDWYLPAKNELYKMYLYATANNLVGNSCTGSKPGGIQCFIGSTANFIYWSSTEYPGINFLDAWNQYFISGDQYYVFKDYGWFGVRAIRAFSNISVYHPVVTDLTKEGKENVDITFSVGDFTDNFYSECDDNLTQVRIITLPDYGTLKLSGLKVNATQEIPIKDITGLTFNPNAYWYGNTNFSWKGYGGFAYSGNDANVNITVVEMDSSMVSESSSSSGKTESIDAPIIYSLSSNSGKIGSEVTITIAGSNFVDGAMKSTVKLTNGNDVVNAVVTGINSNQITCNIDLTGISLVQIGPWDLVVTNPDGRSATLPDGFMVTSGVEPIITEITTEITENILTITIGGSNFLVGITGVQVELTNGTDVIIAVIQTVTDGQIICVVDVGSNPGVLVGEWVVQVTNADEKKSNEKSVRPKGLISSSSKGADKSWILPTAIAIPVGVVAVTAAAASCFILHKHHACCFRNGAKGNGAMMEVNMAAPVYE